MFQIENFTQDSISFLENIKDDDMQSRERVSKNTSFSISSGESRWPLLLLNIFFYKKHWKSCQNLFYSSILGSTGCFFIVPPDFQYHNEKTSSQWESILHWKFLEQVAVVGCNLCFTLVLKIVRKKHSLYVK